MKKGYSFFRLKETLLSAADGIGRVNQWYFAAGVVAVIGVLLIPTFTSIHRELNAVTGPAGGSTAQQAARQQIDPTKIQKQVTVSKGDTLLGILSLAGVDSKDADGIVAALKPIFGPRDLQPGQTISLSLSEDLALGASRLDTFQINVDSTKDIIASVVVPGEFSARVIPQEVSYRPSLVSGTITSSLYDAARAAGLPLGILMEMIRAYSFDVDFQRDVHPGDTFNVVYERAYGSSGRYLVDGDMAFAALTLRGKKTPIYEYRTARGYVDYFNGSGHSVRKMLMRTPVEGAWISSVFGWRKNPIYGYSEFHRGLDFAVPTNTPIMAAGNGTVIVAGYHRDYGNYVQLRHANGYETLYGHMVAFARGIRVGTTVSQGQVIGYVGTTGMSTGPHLHYEVIYRGDRINPATVVSPSGPILTGDELQKFLSAKEHIDEIYADLKAGKPVPSAPGNLVQNSAQSGAGAPGPGGRQG